MLPTPATTHSEPGPGHALSMTARRMAAWAVLWCLLMLIGASLAGHQSRLWSLNALHSQGTDRLLHSINRVRNALKEYRYLPFLLTQNADVKRLLQSDRPQQWSGVSRYLEQMNLVAGSGGLFILNAQGRVLAYSHWRDSEALFAGSHANAPYFTQAKAGEQGRYSSLQVGQAPAYFLSAPIYEQQQFAGAAVVRINLLKLVPELPERGEFMVSDDQGLVFLASWPGWQMQSLTELSAQQRQVVLEAELKVSLWRQPDGKEMLAQQVRLDDLGWTFTILSSTQALQARSRVVVLMTLGGGFALGLLLLYLRERHLKKRSQQETRSALARNEAQQRTIISRSEVGLITLGNGGEILFINPMALRQFGVSQPQVAGLKLSELLAGLEGFLPVQRALSRLNERNFSPVTGYEVVGRRGDGTEFPLLFSIRRMRREPSSQFLVTIIDISRRKKLERALRQANESLEQKVALRTQALADAQQALVQAEKLAALGRMSSAVVHELNQPLTAMRTYISICRQLTTQPAMLQEYLPDNLHRLDELAQRMTQLTRQLKVFAYKKPPVLGPVSLAVVIDQTRLLFRERLASGDIRFECSALDPTLMVLGDSARLEQIFSNLISNGCDAIDSAGGAGQLQLTVQALPERVQIQLTDTGSGIELAMMDQLFEPFITSKPMGSGLGLGLAIVASIVADLGGEISAHNGDQSGACFELWLPRA